MSDSRENQSSRPTIAQIGQLAQEKAAGARKLGHERICPLCGEYVYFNRIVHHIASGHRDELIFQLEQKGAAAK